MQAIILAAGMGRRLKELTANNTKCMVKVNGVTLIERVLKILDKKNLSKIVVVIGYQGDKLKEYISTLKICTPIEYVNNNIYDKTNNIYSLTLAKKYLMAEDTLLFESDLIFDERIVDRLLEDSRKTLAVVDKFENWMDGTCMVLDEEDRILDFLSGKYLNFADKDHYYKTVNIYKFSQSFSENIYIPFLEAYAKAMGNNEYYESVIKLIALLETQEMRAFRLEGEDWYEIDDVQDLDIAETLFNSNIEQKYEAISSRYGGYWRYPKLLDFCYLVNPYFPTPKMIDEINSNFTTLMSQYPSGMRVNSLIAAKNFQLNEKNVVVGNGAAELIKILMENERFESVGFIRPTFEEYPNRHCGKAVIFDSSTCDFHYKITDIIDYYSKNRIDALVLVNPDNPTGNYIGIEEIKKLIKWCQSQNVALIIDESFVDFAFLSNGENWEDYSLLKEEILYLYDKLYVIKSISKSYGVPGFRLGILASSNENKILNIKKSVSIWNINSYGEFFMQILEKYKKDYQRSLNKIKESRQEFIKSLSEIEGIRVFPSQANYVMCELVNDMTSKELAIKLLKDNIFIKDLSSKINNGKQYIRIAVRKKEENLCLVECLKRIIGSTGDKK